ncbi:MAG: hypothetical protein V4580_02125 [Bacteroidota bacterium]
MKKIIVRSILGGAFFISGINAVAQDTIFYKTPGSIVVVLVKEVSQTEVKYKKADMPDGPMYIINKNDIAKIVYKNGYTEVMKESTSTPPVTAEQPLTVTYAAPSVNTGKITFRDTKRRSMYILNLIDSHPSPERKPELMATFSSMKRLKGGQDATRTVGIVFGGITIATGAITALIYSIDSYAGQSFVVVPAAFGAVALISTAAAITCNINLNKKRHKFVDIYNQ